MTRILLPFVRRWRGRRWLKASAIASLILACVMLAAAGAPAGEVSRLTLPNGLRVVIIHSSLAPVVSTVEGAGRSEMRALRHYRKPTPRARRLPGTELYLYARDLPATAGDSRGLLLAFLGDFVEAAPVGVDHYLLSRVFLESSADAIHILRVDLHQPRIAVLPFTYDRGTQIDVRVPMTKRMDP